MFHIILVEPDIPQNTGNIIRLAANTGSTLEIIHPTGFSWDAKALRRAGLDYHDLAHVRHHDNLESLIDIADIQRFWLCSSHAKTPYHKVSFQRGDGLVFGSETRGLSSQHRQALAGHQAITIPMMRHARCLNLANAVSVITYEALRQQHFDFDVIA